MIVIIREIAKLVMFIILWATPIVLVKMLGSSSYLWFFLMSFLGTVALFGHYEDLEKCSYAEDEKDDE